MVNFNLPTFGPSSNAAIPAERGGSLSTKSAYDQRGSTDTSFPEGKSRGASISSAEASLYDYSDASSEELPVVHAPRLRKKWRSSLLSADEPYEKPWLEEKEPKAIMERMIFYFGCLCGGALGVYLCVSAYLKNPHHDVCLTFF